MPRLIPDTYSNRVNEPIIAAATASQRCHPGQRPSAAAYNAPESNRKPIAVLAFMETTPGRMLVSTGIRRIHPASAMQAKVPTRHTAMRGNLRSGSGGWKNTNLLFLAIFIVTGELRAGL
jgi:hypothetical protein